MKYYVLARQQSYINQAKLFSYVASFDSVEEATQFSEVYTDVYAEYMIIKGRELEWEEEYEEVVETRRVLKSKKLKEEA